MSAQLDAIGARLPRPGPDGGYLLAYSGGLDSTVLLHRLAGLSLPAGLRAIHVHHSLQAAADSWPAHCAQACERLKVPFELARVSPDCGPGTSLEAEARRARYAALQAAMRPGDVLLTAHHRDDQAETLLLQLLRGAGPRGLAAMPVWAEFGPGWHVRPLLDIARAELEAYARRHRLSWVEDPSNQDLSHARNFLRREILSRLRDRWPALSSVLGRSAGLCGEAIELLDQQAEEDLQWCAGPLDGSLLIPALRQLEPTRARNLLRAWLGWRGLSPPEEQHLLRLPAELLDAAQDACPLLAWPGAELRRYRELLFAMRPLTQPCRDWQADWTLDETLQLPAGCGELSAEPGRGFALRTPLPEEKVTVRLAADGERLRLPGRAHGTPLKNLFQQAGVPPWVRQRLPLVCFDGKVAAVADRWVCQGFSSTASGSGWRLRWTDPPPGYPSA